jgi:hypothetical protein
VPRVGSHADRAHFIDSDVIFPLLPFSLLFPINSFQIFPVQERKIRLLSQHKLREAKEAAEQERTLRSGRKQAPIITASTILVLDTNCLLGHFDFLKNLIQGEFIVVCIPVAGMLISGHLLSVWLSDLQWKRAVHAFNELIVSLTIDCLMMQCCPSWTG